MYSSQQEESEYSFYWQLIPSELKLEEIIKENPPKFIYNFDFFVHLVYLTIEIPMKNKELRSKDGFVPFHSAILQAKHRDYKKHLDYLVENKILEEQANYKPGVKSRSYRIAESYLKDRLIEIMVSDKNLIKQMAKQRRLDFKVQKKYGYLQKWFNSKLQIDGEAAMAYCIQEIKQASHGDLYQVHQKAYAKMLMVKMLQHKQFWFKVDGFGKRLHTNFTNLSSDLKQYVKYDEENLVSIDIKNSQPYMSLKLLAEKYPEVIQGIRMKSSSNIHSSSIPYPIMLVKDAETLAAIDVQRYASLVVNGTLYEFMEAEMRKEFGDEYFTQEYIFDFSTLEKVKNELTPRERVKRVMFQVFFSKNGKATKEKKLFKKLFPNVMASFENCKGNKRVPKANRHKELAKSLQRTESNIILNQIAKEISRLKPDVPVYTIHDSIVTTFGNEELVMEVMNKLLAGEIGLPPELKVEYWCNDCGELKQAA